MNFDRRKRKQPAMQCLEPPLENKRFNLLLLNQFFLTIPSFVS